MSILSKYLVRVYLEKFLLILSIIAGALLLSNILDTLSKVRGSSIGVGFFIQLAFLKLPYLVSELLPLNTMLAMFLMYYALTKSNEIAIMWGSGVSIFSIILPIASITLIIGILATTTLNPISTYMLARYEAIEAKILHKKNLNVMISSIGVIISEYYLDERRIYMIKSLSVDQKQMNNVTVLLTDKENFFLKRIEADTAIIKDGIITLNNTKVFDKEGRKEPQNQYKIETSLEIANFTKGITAPDNLSFWQLPETISHLASTGLPIAKHLLYYYKILLRPFYMIAYIFLAACFATKDTRSKDSKNKIISGVFFGFIIFLISQIITNILAYNAMGPFISTILPALLITLLSIFSILHLRIS